ncbi:MAG: hypothetical protein ABI068_01865 [Ktedonobacterales bacterium]
MMNRPSKFSFVDEGEAVRRLDVDRETLLAFVQEKRLRSYPGVGKGAFYRVSDLETLAAELRAQRGEEEQEASSGDGRDTGAETAPSTRKVFDPAYKVHVRLQADLKWYDLTDDDLQAWVRELHPDGYTRQRANITSVITKLERMIALMDEAADRWRAREQVRTSGADVAAVEQPAEAAQTDPEGEPS